MPALDRLDRTSRQRDRREVAVRRAAWLVFAVSLATFLIRGAGRPQDPTLIPAGGIVPSRRVSGFGEIAFKVAGRGVTAALATHGRCALLATTAAQQRTGLMNRTDLAGYDGMIFRFANPTTVSFYMKDTLIPLSIAWFDRTGRFVNSTTMAPCPRATANCPNFFANTPYTDAIEVRAGGLPQLGIGPGSTITVGGPC